MIRRPPLHPRQGHGPGESTQCARQLPSAATTSLSRLLQLQPVPKQPQPVERPQEWLRSARAAHRLRLNVSLHALDDLVAQHCPFNDRPHRATHA